MKVGSLRSWRLGARTPAVREQESSIRPAFYLFCCFCCCFCGVYRTSLKMFHSYDDVTIAGEGLQILNYARHSWTLSSEGSLMCHTYCDTGLPFIMVISVDPWHTCCRAFGSGAATSCFYKGLPRPEIEPWSPACKANALPLRHRVFYEMGHPSYIKNTYTHIKMYFEEKK